MMAVMETREHIAALQRDGQLLAGAARRAGLAAAVPSCPPWQVRDLLRHTGHVHRWAAGYVTERHAEYQPGDPPENEVLSGGPPDAELIDWFCAGHAELVQTLATADPALECWTVVPGSSPLASWARRQAHETAIHRVDAELAAGRVTPLPVDFAADGIDELLVAMFGRDEAGLTPEQRAGPHRVLQVVASDEAADPSAWLVELTADGTLAAKVSRGQGTADCTLAGPASGLYQLLWNRCEPGAAGVIVHGDASVLQSWRDGMHVTWS
jgi:uncharacterized protein (TIGR03083 family)